MMDLCLTIRDVWDGEYPVSDPYSREIASAVTVSDGRRIALSVPMDLQLFAKEGPGGEKTEEPTGKRLKDTRDEGNVAKSQEISTCVSLMTLFIMLKILIGWLGNGFRSFIVNTYEDMPETIQMYNGEIPLRTIERLITNGMLRVLMLAGPFFAVGFIVSFITNLIQVKWHVTTKPLKPKLSKLNPISGFKKFFSMRKLFDLGKSILKLVIMGLVLWTYFRGRKESIFLLYDMPLRQCLAAMFDIIVNLGLRIAIIYIPLAVADYAYTRHKWHEDIKMTKQEVKDEYKNQEGDPQIKSKIRQKMMEASRRRMMSALPQADVVITNPTHYAVALKYDKEIYRAPVVIAKGTDHLAAKIKEAAAEHHIEIVEDKPLARMLYANVPLGAEIPPELYEAVAGILAYVYKIKGMI